MSDTLNAFTINKFTNQDIVDFIYLLGLSGCVCLHPINVKTAEMIGLKSCVGHNMTPAKFINHQHFKNLPPTKLDCQ